MSYSISGTTITVSGTVDLMNTSLPSIYRINFAAGGANATFNVRNFMYVPPLGVTFTVVGSARQEQWQLAFQPFAAQQCQRVEEALCERVGMAGAQRPSCRVEDHFPHQRAGDQNLHARRGIPNRLRREIKRGAVSIGDEGAMPGSGRYPGGPPLRKDVAAAFRFDLRGAAGRHCQRLGHGEDPVHKP